MVGSLAVDRKVWTLGNWAVAGWDKAPDRELGMAPDLDTALSWGNYYGMDKALDRVGGWGQGWDNSLDKVCCKACILVGRVLVVRFEAYAYGQILVGSCLVLMAFAFCQSVADGCQVLLASSCQLLVLLAFASCQILVLPEGHLEQQKLSISCLGPGNLGARCRYSLECSAGILLAQTSSN